MRKARGFTLLELLIVVGIVAVLAAVSIPVFASAARKARAAADAANVRAAKAAAGVQTLSDPGTGASDYYYDAEHGTLTAFSAGMAGIQGYGRSLTDPDSDGAEGVPAPGGKAGILAVTVAADGTFAAEWVAGISSVARSAFQTVYGQLAPLLAKKGAVVYSSQLTDAQKSAVYARLSPAGRALLDTHTWYITLDSANRLRVFFAGAAAVSSGSAIVYKLALDGTNKGAYQQTPSALPQSGGALNAGAANAKQQWGYYAADGTWVNNGWSSDLDSLS